MTSQINEAEQETCDGAALNDGMPVTPLKERIAEVMATMQWERQDLMREAKISSSVMTQWQNGMIQSIGKVDTVLRLQQKTGYAAMWLAVGTGPKMANTRELASDPFHVQQITEIARKLPPDRLMKLHEAASKLSFQDPEPASVPPQVAQARIRPEVKVKKTGKRSS